MPSTELHIKIKLGKQQEWIQHKSPTLTVYQFAISLLKNARGCNFIWKSPCQILIPIQIHL